MANEIIEFIYKNCDGGFKIVVTSKLLSVEIELFLEGIGSLL